MKRNILMAIAIGVVMSLTLNAQSQRMQFNAGRRTVNVRQSVRPQAFILPDRNLDDRQREEVQKIRTERQNELTQTGNLLREKRARLEVLQTAEKTDMNEINKVIDEIAALQAQEMKAQAAGRQQIRDLLTDDQRVYYDRRPGVIGENRRTSRNITSSIERLREQRPERLERPERPERPERSRRSTRSESSEG